MGRIERRGPTRGARRVPGPSAMARIPENAAHREVEMNRRLAGRWMRPIALGACLVSLALAGNVLAAQYPPGPHGCCPDTLTIINIQNPLALPHPATGDVVLGVGGVITGFADQAR